MVLVPERFASDLYAIVSNTKSDSLSLGGGQDTLQMIRDALAKLDALVQEFEKAGELRDREVELKAKIDAIVNDKKAKDDAESDAAGDGGPVVNDTDIANIVAQWTGMPLIVQKKRGQVRSSQQIQYNIDARQSCHMHG
jgi:ATP-dependent Clp protease ATP-binding subunit ClpA